MVALRRGQSLGTGARWVWLYKGNTRGPPGGRMFLTVATSGSRLGCSHWGNRVKGTWGLPAVLLTTACESTTTSK